MSQRGIEAGERQISSSSTFVLFRIPGDWVMPPTLGGPPPLLSPLSPMVTSPRKALTDTPSNGV